MFVVGFEGGAFSDHLTGEKWVKEEAPRARFEDLTGAWQTHAAIQEADQTDGPAGRPSIRLGTKWIESIFHLVRASVSKSNEQKTTLKTLLPH